MRTTHNLFLLLVLSTFLFTACADKPKGQDAEVSEAKEETEAEGNKLPLDMESSEVAWKATKVTGAHNGIVQIKSGHLTHEEGKLTGGEFVIDMTTITVQDLEGEEKEKLEGHLKTGDFFLVEEHPEARFVITDIKPSNSDTATHTISGNLTIRGKTNNITFDANVQEMDGGAMMATTVFNIDRTKWDVAFHSGMEEWGDKTIYDEINFDIKLKTKPPKAS